MVGAAYGVFEQVISVQAMNDRQQSDYLAWAKPFHRTVRGEVAVRDGKFVGTIGRGQILKREAVRS